MDFNATNQPVFWDPSRIVQVTLFVKPQQTIQQLFEDCKDYVSPSNRPIFDSIDHMSEVVFDLSTKGVIYIDQDELMKVPPQVTQHWAEELEHANHRVTPKQIRLSSAPMVLTDRTKEQIRTWEETWGIPFDGTLPPKPHTQDFESLRQHLFTRFVNDGSFSELSVEEIDGLPVEFLRMYAERNGLPIPQ
jgi:hypothetical protein